MFNHTSRSSSLFDSRERLNVYLLHINRLICTLSTSIKSKTFDAMQWLLNNIIKLSHYVRIFALFVSLVFDHIRMVALIRKSFLKLYSGSVKCLISQNYHKWFFVDTILTNSGEVQLIMYTK